MRKVSLLVLFLAAALVAGCGPDLPEPRGNFSDGAVPSAVNPTEDCDTDDLYAGDPDCNDTHYATAFGHVGVTTKAQFGEKYGFYETDSGSGSSSKKKKRRKKS